MSKDKKNVSHGYVDRYTGEITMCRTPHSIYESPGVDCQAAIAAGEDYLVEQHHEMECNVNSIMARVLKTSDYSLLQRAHGLYLDLEHLPKSLQETLQFGQKCQDAFDALPADVRKEYDNSSAKFMEAVATDPDKVWKGAEAILATKLERLRPEALPEAPVPQETNVVPDKGKK